MGSESAIYRVLISTASSDENTPGGIAPVTLEGASHEPENPFRTTFDYDGSQNYLDALVKGPHTAGPKKVGPIGNSEIEGYRASLILGGSDPYLQEAKNDGKKLADLVPSPEDIPLHAANFYLEVATFYSFIDFVFMADGTKLVRVWDASVYPAHALYVGESKEGENEFDQGDEWVTQGSTFEHDAFLRFGKEASLTPYTPFDKGSSFGYKSTYTLGSGSHPVMDYDINGTQLTADMVRNQLSSPLFPNSI